MASRTYQRLKLIDFSRFLFDSGDLDPVYVALLAADYPRPVLARWLLAYWLFYHAGFASYAADRVDFWQVLTEAAKNDTLTPLGTRWPRGTERRHFRGDVAIQSVDWLSGTFPEPTKALTYLTKGTLTVEGVIERAKAWPGFGNWIGFKVADMLDAVWGTPVDQGDLAPFLYDTPRKSIVECQADGSVPPGEPADAMRWLKKQLAGTKNPHKLGQSPDFFALETCWCKYHSHRTGHYPKWKDSEELEHGMLQWARLSRLGRMFEAGIPRKPSWTLL